MIKLRLIILLLFCFQHFSWAQTDPRWTATSNTKSIAIGENFSVTFTLSNVEGKNFTPPDFQYFNVAGPPMTGSSTRIFNGRASSSLTWKYTLRPEKTGKFWIKPASILINGKKVFTDKLSIEVTKGRINNAKTDQELTNNIKDQIFVRAELSDTLAVVGQPLILELKLYWIPDVFNVRLMAEPDLSGFYQEDNPRGAYQTNQAQINGKTFKSKTLYRSIIYPQQVGKQTVGFYRILADVQTGAPSRRRSIFSTPSYTRMDLKSENLSVKVVELPRPVPADFSGAVGKLDLDCRVDQRVITTDDAVSLTLTISGEGDTKQMQAPKMKSTDSLEIYPPKLVNEEAFQTPRGILKEKSFEYVLLPKYPSSYSINPDYTYFDVEQMQYMRLFCDTIELRVSQGSNPIGTTVYKEPVIEDGLEGIIASSSESSFPSLKPFSNTLLFGLYGIPVLTMLGVLGLFLYRKNKPEEDLEALKRNRAIEVAMNKLSLAKASMDKNQARQFYDELSKAMYGYLEDKIGIPLSSLNESFIQEKLQSLNIEDELVNKFMEILKNCQLALFAGKTEAGDLKQSYSEAGELIEKLEDRINN